MKVSDYIVEYLIRKGITDVFGYPGGMVTHLMDSFAKYEDKITAHITYHEQGAAIAACGYALVSGKPGVAYATSGPGATNLITGICNAYFDSLPTVFITGQVNANELRGDLKVRQRGFQETDIISLVKSVTKYAEQVDSPEKIGHYLDKAFAIATEGRKGPVLLDIPMNITRSETDNPLPPEVPAEAETEFSPDPLAAETLREALEKAERPCFLIGNGVKNLGYVKQVRSFIDRHGIPAISSMLAFDVIQDDPLYYGFLGAYGSRIANFIAAKSDLVITAGTRLDIRQVGANRKNFAPDAKIIRFDIDPGELGYKVHEDEIQFCQDLGTTAATLDSIHVEKDRSRWIAVCDEIRDLLQEADTDHVGMIIRKLSEFIPDDLIITTDAGQNQVWVPQSLRVKPGQKVLFSGGHAPMGCSLPQAIGACHACGKKPVVCFTGDGGLQMNIQELQYVAREKLPLKIVILNNNALGMIRHFQEMYFNSVYYQTIPEGGYTAPDFKKIGEAYGIRSLQLRPEDLEKAREIFADDQPAILDILIDENTYVYPKLEFGKPNQDQEPLLDRALYDRIMRL